MSEPSSLYMRVTLSQARLDAFLHSPLNSGDYLPHASTDWRSWLDSKRFYGQISDREIAEMNPIRNLGLPPHSTVADFITNLVEDIYFSPGQVQSDPVCHRWSLTVLGLSENYLDFLVTLSVLRAVAQFKDLPGEDFILIYPYLWEPEAGRGANAFLGIDQGHSWFVNDVTEIPVSAIAEADQQIRQLIERGFESGSPP